MPKSSSSVQLVDEINKNGRELRKRASPFGSRYVNLFTKIYLLKKSFKAYFRCSFRVRVPYCKLDKVLSNVVENFPSSKDVDGIRAFLPRKEF